MNGFTTLGDISKHEMTPVCFRGRHLPCTSPFSLLPQSQWQQDGDTMGQCEGMRVAVESSGTESTSRQLARQRTARAAVHDPGSPLSAI